MLEPTDHSGLNVDVRARTGCADGAHVDGARLRHAWVLAIRVSESVQLSQILVINLRRVWVLAIRVFESVQLSQMLFINLRHALVLDIGWVGIGACMPGHRSKHTHWHTHRRTALTHAAARPSTQAPEITCQHIGASTSMAARSGIDHALKDA